MYWIEEALEVVLEVVSVEWGRALAQVLVTEATAAPATPRTDFLTKFLRFMFTPRKAEQPQSASRLRRRPDGWTKAKYLSFIRLANPLSSVMCLAQLLRRSPGQRGVGNAILKFTKVYPELS